MRTVFLILLNLWFAAVTPTLCAQITGIDNSVARAIDHSPQLRALRHNHEAIELDLKQSRAGYAPSLDFEVGYGIEQFSDDTTREAGADPSDSDWDERGEYTLKLIQKVYDGGETGGRVGMQKALRDSANLEISSMTNAIALFAISAHLDVYRQRQIVALAEKNYHIHQDIYELLYQQEQGGTRSIADVNQVQARLARAHSTLFEKKADLSKSFAKYERVVGIRPDMLSYATVPHAIMPKSLEEALSWMEKNNPELLSLDARIREAGERVDLKRSAYKPKVNIELSSRYKDGYEADQSWKNTNEAMLIMRWNLFNGGGDKAGVGAALSRQNQSRSNRNDKFIDLREATASAWTTYLSLKNKKKAYKQAATFSRKTFEAYYDQFSVSKRDLLDVLSAENDYFQSASQLIAVSTDEIIAAYQIVKLTGTLQVPEESVIEKLPEELSSLSEALFLPSAVYTDGTEHQPAPDYEQQNAAPAHVATINPPLESQTNPLGKPDKRASNFALKLGPCINNRELKAVKEILSKNGHDASQTHGSGKVKFTRLLEGKYDADQVNKRLKQLSQYTETAFVLQQDGQFALFAGSFHNRRRAEKYARLLEKRQIKVTPIETKVKMQGTILVVERIDAHMAEKIAAQLTKLGVSTKLMATERMATNLNPDMLSAIK